MGMLRRLPCLIKGHTMEKNEFGNLIKERLEEKYEGKAEIKLQEVRKNNGVTMLGVMVKDQEKNIAPTLYLDELYHEYQGGRDLEEIFGVIADNLERGMPKAPIDMEFFTDYSQVKEKLCYKLVNQERNEELLKTIPNLPFLDLAICFFYSFWHKSIGSGSILVRNEHLERWGVTVSDLWHDANENTRKLFPEQCCPMNEVINGLRMADQRTWPALPEESCESPISMKILTNHQYACGASVVLYDDYLHKIRESLGRDFFLLPCSIHEMLLLPKDETDDMEFLEWLVRDVNEKFVDPQDYLSDHVYYYDGEKKSVSIVTP